MEGKKYTFAKIVIVIAMIAWGLVVLVAIPYNYYLQANKSIDLADNGVFATAKILEYRYGSGKGSHGFYLISYDNYKGLIKITNTNYGYPIGGKVPIIYDKYNPKLVEWGHNGISAWELYKLNTNLYMDIIGWTFWFIGSIIGSIIWVKIVPRLLK